MSGWDPAQYLKFAGERLRPAVDLVARLTEEAPATICDLGCGTGQSTRLLAGRWPRAAVTGVDGSAEMLAKARVGGGNISWIRADLDRWAPDPPPDLLFANAALQWLDGHDRLFPRLMGELRPGGVLAVQMPRNHGEPSHVAITEAAAAGSWHRRLAPLLRPAPVKPPQAYYEILAAAARSLEIWETVYLHVLEGDDPVVEWTRGSALRPFLDALDGDERQAFLAEYAARVGSAYPRRPDGRTLFPFRRLFIVARR